MRSPNRSASSMKCVVSTITRPARARRSRSHVWRRAVGSSRNTTFEPPMRAIPRERRRFIPPDSVQAQASALSSSSISRMVLRIAAAAAPPRRPLSPA